MTGLSSNKDSAMIMAGGTGGHIFPGLAVAKELTNQGWQVTWLGSVNGMEERLVSENGVDIDLISVTGLRGKGIIGWLKMPFTLSKAVWEARKNIKKRKPNVIIGFGGFVAGPGGIASKITSTPLVIHEQNAVAGMTNRFLAKIADKVFQAFPSAFEESRKVKTIGNPIRSDIAKLHKVQNEPIGACVNVLIIGGSRGA
ncbi:MAG: UDP-N-acetylglucosamine--N-acetylmuramyl-(pentapeptide) pyrophosphoryl-undecaprenol N-acetylglucosamine transferase, partial [Kangiellaceae bacterium]|nr:UDP-N-acetylglucosamine--N-acetylmuramyl-(pentapeptide) pyrophosphoryl-undecaprenol N-acetylglucosamine transferase [Kangiellaceae bacterium]